jgi:hypothetical protein
VQEGTIVLMNQRRGMFVVQIDDGDFVIFELLAGIDVAVGDRVKGELEALGREDLQHVGQRRRFAAYGQSDPSSLAACRRRLGN